MPGRYRAGDIRHCVADVSRIRAELGYEPRVAFERGRARAPRLARTARRPTTASTQATRELDARGLAR